MILCGGANHLAHKIVANTGTWWEKFFHVLVVFFIVDHKSSTIGPVINIVVCRPIVVGVPVFYIAFYWWKY